MSVRQAARAALSLTDPAAKVAATHTLWQQAGAADLASEAAVTAAELIAREPAPIPGRPDQPKLVHPKEVAQRSVHTPAGRAALLHAVVHIEFNAINLALDAVWRFGGMPQRYYLDWMLVAAEEARHFRLLRDHLRSQGHDYGDFPAHQGLWTMCEKTRHDILARMALVPRTLEARGLDATPQIQAKLRQVGTPDALAAVAILDTILRDEVGHVAIGNHWYRWLCGRAGHDPETHYATLVAQYEAPRLKPPFNETARKKAGFTDNELRWLQQL